MHHFLTVSRETPRGSSRHRIRYPHAAANFSASRYVIGRSPRSIAEMVVALNPSRLPSRVCDRPARWRTSLSTSNSRSGLFGCGLATTLPTIR